MIGDREGSVERSVPVQSRVDFITLAELALYFERLGTPPRTMSQLISWSLDHLVHGWSEAGLLDRCIEDSEHAMEVLSVRGLLQRSMLKRSMKKIHNAIAFENLRKEGVDPRGYAPVMYDTIHNTNSVKPTEHRHKRRALHTDFSESDWRRAESMIPGMVKELKAKTQPPSTSTPDKPTKPPKLTIEQRRDDSPEGKAFRAEHDRKLREWEASQW